MDMADLLLESANGIWMTDSLVWLTPDSPHANIGTVSQDPV